MPATAPEHRAANQSSRSLRRAIAQTHRPTRNTAPALLFRRARAQLINHQADAADPPEGSVCSRSNARRCLLIATRMDRSCKRNQLVGHKSHEKCLSNPGCGWSTHSGRGRRAANPGLRPAVVAALRTVTPAPPTGSQRLTGHHGKQVAIAEDQGSTRMLDRSVTGGRWPAGCRVDSQSLVEHSAGVGAAE